LVTLAILGGNVDVQPEKITENIAYNWIQNDNQYTYFGIYKACR
jgi:hypothetical protein